MNKNVLREFTLQSYNDTADARLAAARWTLRLKDMYANRNGNRAYHNIKHVFEMVRMLGCTSAYGNNLLLDSYIAWFHDCVYDTDSSDVVNVGRSADQAALSLTEMCVAKADILYVQGGIQATAGHHPTEVYKHIVDADLAVLSWEWNAYKQYVTAIRKEYKQYSNEDFVLGRQLFLEQLLARPKVFQLTENFSLFEDRARANMQVELDTINAHPKRYLRWFV